MSCWGLFNLTLALFSNNQAEKSSNLLRKTRHIKPKSLKFSDWLSKLELLIGFIGFFNLTLSGRPSGVYIGYGLFNLTMSCWGLSNLTLRLELLIGLMDKILHDPKDPKLWELWHIPYYESCRILSINRRVYRVLQPDPFGASVWCLYTGCST